MSDIATQTTTPSNSSVVLEVRGLVKEYRKAGSPFKRADTFEAVSNVSLDVRQGEIVCLLGESGCGKTTLARMIMHLTRPTAGTITLNGCEMQGLNERRFRPLRQYIQMQQTRGIVAGRTAEAVASGIIKGRANAQNLRDASGMRP